jgi:hypothetical protein
MSKPKAGEDALLKVKVVEVTSVGLVVLLPSVSAPNERHFFYDSANVIFPASALAAPQPHDNLKRHQEAYERRLKLIQQEEEKVPGRVETRGGERKGSPSEEQADSPLGPESLGCVYCRMTEHHAQDCSCWCHKRSMGMRQRITEIVAALWIWDRNDAAQPEKARKELLEILAAPQPSTNEATFETWWRQKGALFRMDIGKAAAQASYEAGQARACAEATDKVREALLDLTERAERARAILRDPARNAEWNMLDTAKARAALGKGA